MKAMDQRDLDYVRPAVGVLGVMSFQAGESTLSRGGRFPLSEALICAWVVFMVELASSHACERSFRRYYLSER